MKQRANAITEQDRPEDSLLPDFHRFLDYFETATSEIGHRYIGLPVAGQETLVHRERVYCYELYHRLRLAMEPDFSYTLGGEVDKKGHPILRDGDLKSAKPDFLVHHAGSMGNNLVVIEVKSITGARKDGIKKDLRRLCAFRRYAGYHYAVHLIYGDGDIERIRKQTIALSRDSSDHEIDLGLIYFYHHGRAREEARRLDWD